MDAKEPVTYKKLSGCFTCLAIPFSWSAQSVLFYCYIPFTDYCWGILFCVYLHMGSWLPAAGLGPWSRAPVCQVSETTCQPQRGTSDHRDLFVCGASSWCEYGCAGEWTASWMRQQPQGLFHMLGRLGPRQSLADLCGMCVCIFRGQHLSCSARKEQD